MDFSASESLGSESKVQRGSQAQTYSLWHICNLWHRQANLGPVMQQIRRHKQMKGGLRAAYHEQRPY